MGNPNSRSLAMRDPALAALLGIAAVAAPNQGAVMAGRSQFGAEFGSNWNGADFGDDYGAEFGAAEAAQMTQATAAAPPATPSAMLQVWQQHHAQKMQTASRQRLLEPNAGSTAKVERYAFSINQTVTLGTAVALNMSGNPDTTIRPQRVTINAPTPGFGTIAEIKVANVSVTVGGVEDAFDYSALGVGQSLDMPTLSPANRATVLGNYTGFVPPGFVNGVSYLISCSFKGPAQIVA